MVDFSKDYLHRNVINKDNKTSILMLGIEGEREFITCIESDSSLKVLLIGMSNGYIKSIFLTQYDEKDQGMEEA